MWPFILAFINIVHIDTERIALEAAALACFVSLPALALLLRSRLPAIFATIGCAVCLLPAAPIVAIIALYLATPLHFDHGDAAIASIGAAMRNGQISHSGLDPSADFYSLPYGPLLDQIQSAVAAWPSVLTSKLPGVIAFVLGIAAMIASLRRVPLCISGPFYCLVALIVLSQRHMAFSVRGEPLLLLLASLSTFVVLRDKSRFAALFVGTAAGLAAGMKLTGFLFMVPHAFAIMFAIRDRTALAKCAATMAISATLTFVAPHLASNVNLDGYYRQLLLSAQAGFSFPSLVENIIVLALMMAPAIALGARRDFTMTKSERGALIGMGLAGLCLIVIGSKNGSGPYTLLPFIPICAGFLAAFAGGLPIGRGLKTCATNAITCLGVLLV